MKIALIGAGRIGSEIYKRAKELGWEFNFILKDDGVYKDLDKKIDKIENFRNYLKDSDITFLAIPTLDDGRAAFNYIMSSLDNKIPVVTCEKGALSNYFSELEKKLNMIGYSATVGGGTRLLRYLEEIVNKDVEEIHAVVNGTLNYIFDEVSRGRSLGEVVEETKKLGYAEPGTVSNLDVINKEATEDVPMKSSILFNISGLSDRNMRAQDVKSCSIDEKQLKNLVKESNNRRYIVSIMKENNEKDVIGSFSHKVGDWYIVGGFKDIRENPLFSRLVLSGVNNSLLVCKGKYGIDGTYMVSGQGAGAGPTVTSMLKDATALIQREI